MKTSVIIPPEQKSLVLVNHVTYALYLISYFTAGLLWIVPIIINYLKRSEARGTWLESHFAWQIKTFWYSIIWVVLGIILITVALGGVGLSVWYDSSLVVGSSLWLLAAGVLIVVFTILWHLYRVVRGWIALADKRSLP